MGETKMGTKYQKWFPFVLNTVNGNVISSLLHRPWQGIEAVQSALVKMLSAKTNLLSERVNEIRSPVLCVFGSEDSVVSNVCGEYLAQKLVSSEQKQVRYLSGAGHLWWLTHAQESAAMISE